MFLLFSIILPTPLNCQTSFLVSDGAKAFMTLHIPWEPGNWVTVALLSGSEWGSRLMS